MFAYISGIVESTQSDQVVIDCGGVGFEVHTNPASLQSLFVGKEARLFTHFIVREDAFSLYGFISREDRQMFARLISVTGIGPRLALSVLSVLSAPQVAMAVISADEKALVRVPGLGKKSAQRLILELKGKMQPADAASAGMVMPSVGADAVDEAIDILTAMGFAPVDSAAAVALVLAEGGTPEQTAMNALRRLDRK
jgi:Holliday junction DNA helicase RuvA